MNSFSISPRLYRKSIYTGLRKIGEGGHSEVYLAKNSENGKTVVIKRLFRRPNNEDKILAERETYSLFKLLPDCGKYIVCVSDFFIVDNEFFIVMDFIPNAEDLYFFQKRPQNFLTKFIIAYRLIQGLHLIHSNNIIHQDIKPPNILITEDLRALYIDFGGSCDKRDMNCRRDRTTFTPYYMSPEALEDEKGTISLVKADIYSLGIVLFEFLLEKKFRLSDEKRIFYTDVKYQKKKIKKFEKDFSKDPEKSFFFDIIRKMLTPEPNRRTRLTTVLDKLNKDYYRLKDVALPKLKFPRYGMLRSLAHDY